MPVGPGPRHARSGERAHPLCNYSFCATPEIWTREWGPTGGGEVLGEKDRGGERKRRKKGRRTVDNSQDGIVPRAKNRSVLACYRMKKREREREREKENGGPPSSVLHPSSENVPVFCNGRGATARRRTRAIAVTIMQARYAAYRIVSATLVIPPAFAPREGGGPADGEEGCLE